jgi:hypothetical protein
MKCICGYEKTWDTDRGEIGDAEFVVLKSTFVFDNGSGRDVSTYLYACPKCGAVRIKE